tara:strand:+ start:875 stop:1024 length:150 start_codon:yes stop_codon:yes gene_type:complete
VVKNELPKNLHIKSLLFSDLREINYVKSYQKLAIKKPRQCWAFLIYLID